MVLAVVKLWTICGFGGGVSMRYRVTKAGGCDCDLERKSDVYMDPARG